MAWLVPGLLLALLLTLVVAQLFWVFWPHRPSSYPWLLLGAALGIGAGQLWGWLGLPSLSLGSANLLPGLTLALVVAPLLERLFSRRQMTWRGPDEKAPKIR